MGFEMRKAVLNYKTLILAKIHESVKVFVEMLIAGADLRTLLSI